MPVLVDELERLVHTLQDDAARTKLVEQLRALIAVQRGAETEKPAATALFGQLSQQIDAFSGEILAGVAMVVDAPRLFGWARPSNELRIGDGEHAVLPLPLSGDKLVAGFPFGAKDVEKGREAAHDRIQVRSGLAAGGKRIRTCMGLFLSSGCFGLC
jgi:hypothetical protein